MHREKGRDVSEQALFQRYYAAVLFREYKIRKASPLGKQAWRNLMEWAWKARCKARELECAGQLEMNL